MVLRLYVAAAALVAASVCSGAPAAPGASVQELRRGFLATHDPSYSQFQPVLSDPTGVFSLGFLRLNATLLELAVLHLPSSLPLWRAVPDRPATWSAAATLSFDGNLVLADSATRAVIWSAARNAGGAAAAAGDRVVLLNSSNLQIQSISSGGSSYNVLWESFRFPSDTIVQNQNFTSAAALISSNRQFSMRLRANYFALFMEPPASGGATAMYWKHTALEAKAQIVAGGGPVYARVEEDGFLGMYQKEGAPADVLAFDTFNRGVRGVRRMTLALDGNLRAYYWNGSVWVADYTAITDPCQLPTTCGGYSVCASGQCACLANATEGSGCVAAAAASGDLCGQAVGEAVRRAGVEPANKELMEFERAGSAADCEGRCERNCSCWGAVYSNATGLCYLMDYPARMLVEGDERKVGYFKVRRAEAAPDGGGGNTERAKVALLAVGAVVAAAAAAAAGFGAYRIWKRRKRIGGEEKEAAATRDSRRGRTRILAPSAPSSSLAWIPSASSETVRCRT